MCAAWFKPRPSRAVIELRSRNHNGVIHRCARADQISTDATWLEETPVTKDRASMEFAPAEMVADDSTTADVGADGDGADGLVRRDREILAFERQWWKYAGAKEQAIRELFDMSSTRYYQVLNSLIDNPAALAADPMLVKRLRRLRAARQRQRSARRLGIDV
jgi:hypothetical protein